MIELQMISLTGILSQALALSRSVHFCKLFLGFKKFVLSVFWPLNVATSIGVMWRASELFVKCSWLRFCWGMGLCTESEVGLEETGGQRWRCSMRPRVPSSAEDQQTWTAVSLGKRRVHLGLLCWHKRALHYLTALFEAILHLAGNVSDMTPWF